MADSIDIDQLAPPTVERDRWGRYLITDPADPAKKLSFTRVTTFAKAIDDTINLQRWQQRMVAIGLARRPALQAAVASCDPDDKQKLNDLCEQARTAAGADDASEIGTALHAFTERLDRGQDVNVPADWEADMAAYQAALAAHGIEIVPELIEQTVVVPRWDVAGTADRIVRWNNQMVIADLKTGQSIAWSLGAIAVQLACYANAATIYDHATKTHRPMPEVSTTTGLIIHLPAGRGVCDVWTVDLTVGAGLADLCAHVRTARKRKDVARKSTPVTPVTPEEPVVSPPDPPAVPEATLAELRAWITGRLAAIKAADPAALRQVAARWPLDTPTLKQSDSHTAEQLDSIAAVLDQIEPEIGMNPFEIPARPHQQATRADRDWWHKQLAALPADLRADAVKAAGVDLDRSTIVWAADIRKCKAALAQVQPVMDARVDEIDAAVAVIDPDRTRLELVARTVSCHKVANIDLLEHRHLAPLQGLAGLVAAGLAAIGPDSHGEHRVHWPDPAGIERHLVGLCGNKTAAVTAGKTLAGLLGGLKPQTFQQLLDSPGLVAGIHHQHTTKPQLSKGTAA